MSAPARPATLPASLYPFASHVHDCGGHRMHYLDEGSGPPVVCLHGNPTWSFYYRRVVEAFRDRYRVLVPDHIGMGLSDKPQDYPYTLATHIDNLESLLAARLGAAERVTLVLHDWGGAIGMGWAVRHPERVARIVVSNTAAFRSERLPFRIYLCRLPLLGALAVRGLNAFAAAALTMATEKPLSAEVKRGLLAPYDSWSARVAILRFVQDIPMTARDPSYAVLSEIEGQLSRFCETPMLLQWGGADWCFDKSFFDAWRERFPRAEADWYADAGHYVLEDAHERILPRMDAFLGRGG